MLKNLSWSVYLEVVVTLLIIYYCVIGFLYYREELKNLLNGKLPQKKKPAMQNSQNSFKETDKEFDELEAMVKDLRYAILERVVSPVSKEELLHHLQRRLYNYQGLQRPAYRTAINNFIITNAKEINGVVFSEDELNVAWDELPR